MATCCCLLQILVGCVGNVLLPCTVDSCFVMHINIANLETSSSWTEVADRKVAHTAFITTIGSDAARRESILQPKHAKPSFFSGLRQTSDLSPKNSGKITVCDQCHCHWSCHWVHPRCLLWLVLSRSLREGGNSRRWTSCKLELATEKTRATLWHVMRYVNRIPWCFANLSWSNLLFALNAGIDYSNRYVQCQRHSVNQPATTKEQPKQPASQ